MISVLLLGSILSTDVSISFIFSLSDILDKESSSIFLSSLFSFGTKFLSFVSIKNSLYFLVFFIKLYGKDPHVSFIKHKW